MKVYEVIISDFDLYGEYGLFRTKETAKQKMKELLADPKFHWKKYLKIKEKDLY